MEPYRDTYSIRHEVGVRSSPEEIYQALTDTKKLAQWWTSDTRGNGSRVGEVLEFWFGDFCQKFEVVELEARSLVRWRANRQECVKEWEGTEITFSFTPDEKQCTLRFSHSGWKDDEGMLPHCSTKWAVFMLSLKDLLEKGKGQPSPDSVQIDYD